jgi:NAD(P)-dependent dehydrogenase (short-subunit alcohol dehydrogenase family)
MALKSVFITGCNRGIGLELGKQLYGAGTTVFIPDRVPVPTLKKFLIRIQNIPYLAVFFSQNIAF